MSNLKVWLTQPVQPKSALPPLQMSHTARHTWSAALQGLFSSEGSSVKKARSATSD